jgi:hypothetical protein
LGSKIYVNFTKYDFDECMRRLNGELQGVPNFAEFQKHTNNANGNSSASGNANKVSQNSSNKTKEPEKLDEYIKIAKKESDEFRRDMTASLAQQRHEYTEYFTNHAKRIEKLERALKPFLKAKSTALTHTP